MSKEVSPELQRGAAGQCGPGSLHSRDHQDGQHMSPKLGKIKRGVHGWEFLSADLLWQLSRMAVGRSSLCAQGAALTQLRLK